VEGAGKVIFEIANTSRFFETAAGIFTPNQTVILLKLKRKARPWHKVVSGHMRTRQDLMLAVSPLWVPFAGPLKISQQSASKGRYGSYGSSLLLRAWDRKNQCDKKEKRKRPI
jgi:hypothetical protein